MKPHLFFMDGYWCVMRRSQLWKNLSAKERDRSNAAHVHALKLNQDPTYVAMRHAYYATMHRESKAERAVRRDRTRQEKRETVERLQRVRDQKAFAMTTSAVPEGPVSLYDLLNGR